MQLPKIYSKESNHFAGNRIYYLDQQPFAISLAAQLFHPQLSSILQRGGSS